MHRSKILLVLLVTGLLLAACVPVVVKQASPETKELVIRTWGNPGGNTIITVISANDEKSSAYAGDVFWFYDVAENQVEYLVISDTTLYLHLHENKNPK